MRKAEFKVEVQSSKLEERTRKTANALGGRGRSSKFKVRRSKGKEGSEKTEAAMRSVDNTRGTRDRTGGRRREPVGEGLLLGNARGHGSECLPIKNARGARRAGGTGAIGPRRVRGSPPECRISAHQPSPVSKVQLRVVDRHNEICGYVRTAPSRSRLGSQRRDRQNGLCRTSRCGETDRASSGRLHRPTIPALSAR